MTIALEAENGARRMEVLQALKALAMHDTRATDPDAQTPVLSAFVTRSRETISSLVMPTAGLVIVIEGRKELISASGQRVFNAGDAFVLPASARVDVVNDPDPATGVYRALFISFRRELVIEAARLWPQFVGRRPGVGEPVISAELCSAVLHCGEALSHRTPVSRRVVDHRILEILLVLAEQGVLPLVPKYVQGSVVEAVRLLVRHRLHWPWTAAVVAAELAMSEATLRRRLRQEGHTLQDTLRTERMEAAYIVLHDRDADVADALAATGYRSRSHFARHFHDRFGATPSAVRHNRARSVAS
jgi:AraC-like DNA-binding protein